MAFYRYPFCHQSWLDILFPDADNRFQLLLEQLQEKCRKCIHDLQLQSSRTLLACLVCMIVVQHCCNGLDILEYSFPDVPAPSSINGITCNDKSSLQYLDGIVLSIRTPSLTDEGSTLFRSCKISGQILRVLCLKCCLLRNMALFSPISLITFKNLPPEPPPTSKASVWG